MKIGYADPPYPGCAHMYKDHPDYAGEVDHAALVERLNAEFSGWVLHTSSVALPQILPGRGAAAGCGAVRGGVMSGAVIGFVEWGRVRVAVMAPNLPARIAMSAAAARTTPDGFLELMAAIVSRCCADPKTFERPFSEPRDRDLLLRELRRSYPDGAAWVAATKISDMVREHLAGRRRAYVFRDERALRKLRLCRT